MLRLYSNLFKCLFVLLHNMFYFLTQWFNTYFIHTETILIIFIRNTR